MLSFSPSVLLSYLALSSKFAISLARPGKAVFKNAPVYVPLSKCRDNNNDGSEAPQLIGDLRNAAPTTEVGTTVVNILLGSEDAQSDVGPPPLNYPPESIGTYADKCLKFKKEQDRYCVWYGISVQLTKDFLGPNGRCNNLARAAVRLGFHDAGTWSQKLADDGQDFGAADGSFIIFNEIQRAENNGLQGMDAYTRKLHSKFPSVSFANLIQYMAIHATVSCPQGPRIRFFAGRKDTTQPSSEGLLPSVSADADTLVQLFIDKTIAPHDLAALLGAHSTSKQFHVDDSAANVRKPQDSTPGVWDVKFFNETLQDKPAPGTFRFQSDEVLSRDSRLNGQWKAFVGDQQHWNEEFARSYVRLSLLGVNNINQLTECTKSLPPARPFFVKAAKAYNGH